MTVELHAEEIEDFAFLEFTGAPDRRERGHVGAIGAVGGAQPDDDRAVLLRHRVQVIDDLEGAGLDSLGLLLDDLRGATGGIGHADLGALDDFFLGPVDAGDVRAVIELQFRVVPEEQRHRRRVGETERKRVLRRGAGIRHQRDLGAGEPGQQAVADLLERFHQAFSERTICGGCQTAGLAGGSRSRSPNSGTG